MSARPQLPRRNLQRGWCPQGDPLSTAQKRLDPAAKLHIASLFSTADPGESRAATLLHAFTGLTPKLEDDQGVGQGARDGAVDLILADEGDKHEIVELTSSLDRRYEQAAAAIEKFERAIADGYRGKLTWLLDFEQGWEGNRLLSNLAPTIARVLNDADPLLPETEVLEAHPHVRASRLGRIGTLEC